RSATLARIRAIHRGKTGALFTAAVRVGALVAGARPPLLHRLTTYGEQLGLCFQIVDDILDAVQAGDGRTDAALGKATYPAVLGMARARTHAEKARDRALAALAPLGARAEALREIARVVVAQLDEAAPKASARCSRAVGAAVLLDRLLVHLGLGPSRERAQRLILAGEVLVGDRPATKPGTMVAADAPLRLRRAPSDYVSRGGEKLAGALDAFGLEVAGQVALDVGASTGGFTDCLLRRGARRVVALDVGYGQLAWPLRQDAPVTVLERINARRLEGSMVAGAPCLAT